MRYVDRMVIASAALLLSACQFVPTAKDSAKPAALQDIPPAAQAAFDSALTAQRAQQWPQAEQQLQQLADKYPQLSGPSLNLALIYAQTGRPQLAEEAFKRALQINPANLDACDQYGIWLRGQGRFAEAEAIYSQALARDPARASTQLDLAILYDLYLGKLPQALEHYQRYLELTADEKSPVHGWVADLQRRLKAAG